MTITLIRHGKTFGNTKGQYVGSTDEDLCGIGISEINSYLSRYPKAEHVFVSPMKRTLQTKKLIYGDTSEEIIMDLRECCFGDFEGKTYEQLKDDPHYQRWIDNNTTPPNGESFESFNGRVQTAFLDCIEKSINKGYKSVAFAVHGGTIMAVMDKFSGDNKTYFDFRVNNGGGYILSLDEKYWEQTHMMKSYREIENI